MNSDSCVPKHGFGTCRCDYDLVIYMPIRQSMPCDQKELSRTRVLYGIRKRRDHTELKFLLGIVPWYAQQRTPVELFLVNLESLISIYSNRTDAECIPQDWRA